MFSSMQVAALRLKPGQDLKLELEQFVQDHRLEAACIVTCVGSLTQAMLRLANQSEGTIYQGHLEIVSLMGVMSCHGSHYHLSIAERTGQTFGGHLLEGCRIYTTAEIVIGIMPELRFRREHDLDSGYRELTIEDF
ncbi:PPC domain-containing DNA-binding protein [Leptolyngbya sp. FACHB-711]|uniref:PPC domain-containing DNA-binding protein n=1 Tax=unclassified Leptolyngbya TaxID=2650499 RepID=UPI001F557E83|nr:PPC domain-containing DNA-binding protein [Leptolyngbya sp. FACHB-711]